MKRILMGVVGMMLVAGMAHAGSVQVARKEGVGNYLADGKGMTLYYFTKDAAAQSFCTGECLVKWPEFYLQNAEGLPAGLTAADFGTITRADGKKQTTFKDMPLYYFFKDKAAGDTMGQGVNNVWYVVDPAAFKP